MRPTLAIGAPLHPAGCATTYTSSVEDDDDAVWTPRMEAAEAVAICDVDSLAATRKSYKADVQRVEAYADNMEKMRQFDAEIDAQYRAVTSSCKAYILCMENNYYDEGACRSSEARWRDSEERFSALAVRLRELSRPPATASRKKAAEKKSKSCDVVGGVFTDDC